MKQVNVPDVLKETFHKVQFNKTCHQSNIKKLKKFYEQSNESEFWESFEALFKVPLAFPQRHQRVQNILIFIIKFAASFYTTTNADESSEEPLCPFLAKLFDFLLTNHCVKDPNIRFRICLCLNMLLNSMGDHAYIDDSLCDRIIVCMTDRLLDKMPKIRAQAIIALQRLQDPSDDQCPIIKMYIFHATKDPKAEVRKAALMSMGKSQRTLQVALRRTRDVDEGVRKVAYDFISQVTVRSLTISQRDQLLNDGLKDRSEIVRKTVKNVLLPAWLRHFNGEFIKLIRALDAEIGTDVSILALETLFEKTALNTLIEQLPINNETKSIPLKGLVSENVLYWKCLIKHVQRVSTEDLELILPELSTFCNYISDLLNMMSGEQNEKHVYHMHKFVLLQLFQIATTYDLSDEAGRKKLNELILNVLMSNHWSQEIIECVVTHLEKVIPDVNSRLDTLTNLISEIRLPLTNTQATQVTQISDEQQHQINMDRAKLKMKLIELKDQEYEAIQKKEYLKANNLKDEIENLSERIKSLEKPAEVPLSMNNEEIKEKSDSETMIKCLNIMCVMMQSVTKLTPTLRNFTQIAIESLDHPDHNVNVLAIRVISICCVLDKEMAKNYIMLLILPFSMEQEITNIWLAALKGIFDLLLLYGLEYFDMQGKAEETNNKTTSTEQSRTKLFTDTNSEVSLSIRNSRVEQGSFIKILMGLLDHADQEIRTLATEGLCKLLLSRRISSRNLLSKLIILCYNPVNDSDFYLRQCLSCFFDNFFARVPDAAILFEQAYLPTLQIMYHASEFSPLLEIDPYEVSSFMLNMIRFGSLSFNRANNCAHNNLVFTILTEILNEQSSIDQKMLIKSLKCLHFSFDDDVSKQNLREAIDKVKEQIGDSDKRLLQYIEQFKKKVDAGHSGEVPENDTEDETED